MLLTSSFCRKIASLAETPGDPALIGLYCCCRNSDAFWNGFFRGCGGRFGAAEIQGRS